MQYPTSRSALTTPAVVTLSEPNTDLGASEFDGSKLDGAGLCTGAREALERGERFDGMLLQSKRADYKSMHLRLDGIAGGFPRDAT